jgi:hypothetical protein
LPYKGEFDGQHKQKAAIWTEQRAHLYSEQESGKIFRLESSYIQDKIPVRLRTRTCVIQYLRMLLLKDLGQKSDNILEQEFCMILGNFPVILRSKSGNQFRTSLTLLFTMG